MKKSISLLVGFALILMIVNPNVCKNGAIYGLLLSSNVIIPSLFPFSVFVLFTLNSGLLQDLKIKTTLCVFILSLIGGYPIGAKVLNEAVEGDKIAPKTARNMINYCVNAGPAFIILAVGCGILNSKTIGYLLFISHIFASIILSLFFGKETAVKPQQKKETNIIDNFISSVSSSASAIISICSYVVLFSVILNYITFYSQHFKFLKYISYLLEVTNATSQTKNIIFISFLLGFSGICVWFQVWGMCRNFKINYLKFILFRVLHGTLSGGFTYLIIKIFKISLPSLSNGINTSYCFTNCTPQVAFSLIIMGIIFIISLSTKNYAGNLLEDLV